MSLLNMCSSNCGFTWKYLQTTLESFSGGVNAKCWSRAFTHPNPHISVWTDVLVLNFILFSLHLKLLCGSDYLSALNAGSTNICYKFPNNSRAKCKNVQRFELLHSAYTFWYRNFISLRPCCVYILKVTTISLNSMYTVFLPFAKSFAACRDHSGYGLSQWETTLWFNVVSHWLRPHPEWKWLA